jgi:cytidine deaminase
VHGGAARIKITGKRWRARQHIAACIAAMEAHTARYAPCDACNQSLPISYGTD